jgi:hypothetical protein
MYIPAPWPDEAGQVDLSRFLFRNVHFSSPFFGKCRQAKAILYKSHHFSQISVPGGFFYVNFYKKFQSPVFLD